MKPTIYQRVKEINERLEINLQSEGRQKINFYLRVLIANEYSEMTLQAIADSLSVDHSSVQYYRNRFSDVSQTDEYKFVVEALRLGIKPVFIKHKRKRKISRKLKDSTELPSKKEMFREFVSPRSMPQNKVIDVLKKDYKNYLWNKNISLWTGVDWDNFDKLKSA
jgi:hypothetical protein